MFNCDCCGQEALMGITIPGYGYFCDLCGKTIQLALEDESDRLDWLRHCGQHDQNGSFGGYTYTGLKHNKPSQPSHYNHSPCNIDPVDELAGVRRKKKQQSKQTVHYTITTSDIDASSFVALRGDLPEKSVIMVASDAESSPRYFAFYYSELGTNRVWTAEEIYLAIGADGKKKKIRMDTHYVFRVFADQEDEAAFARLQEKVEIGIRNQSIERRDVEGRPCDNTLLRNGQEYSLKDIGSIRIVYSDDDISKVSFIVDGQHFTPTELATMMSCHEGAVMRYQMVDETEPEMEADMMLLPVKVSAKALLEELDEAIALTVTKGNFVSENRILLFDKIFYVILDKLALLYSNSPRGKVKLLGMEMIKRLEVLDTTDDVFPDYEISAIRDIIGGV